MAITGYSGPIVAFGQSLTSSGAAAEYNPARAPSGFDLATVLLDPRGPFNYDPGQSATTKFYGWPLNGPVVDATPSAKSSNGIVPASSQQTGTTALTIASSAVTPVNVTQVTTFVPSTGTKAVTVWAIDTAMSGLGFGSDATLNVWDPSKALARAVSIGSTANESGVNYTIAGYDLYGYAMTQTLAGPNNGTVNTTKAFKYVASITPSASVVSSNGVRVGVADIFGMPLYMSNPAYVDVWIGVPSSNSVLVANTSNFTAGSTSAASATTGDVRGTYSSTGATTEGSSVRVTIFQSLNYNSLASVGSTNFSGLIGVNQF